MAITRIDPDVPYKAFSGANIQAVIGNKVVGSLQAVTVSITREVAALYGMGSPDPRAFVKGKRGIAGTMVFTQFDRDAVLYDVFNGINSTPLQNIRPDFVTSRFATMSRDKDLLGQPLQGTLNWSNPSEISTQINQSFGSPIAADLADHLKSVYNLVGTQKLRYADQIPEFDVTLTMVNESGDAAYCVIGGVTLVNEGFGFSLDDLTSEKAHTYVARYITPLTSISDATHFARDRAQAVR